MHQFLPILIITIAIATVLNVVLRRFNIPTVIGYRVIHGLGPEIKRLERLKTLFGHVGENYRRLAEVG